MQISNEGTLHGITPEIRPFAMNGLQSNRPMHTCYCYECNYIIVHRICIFLLRVRAAYIVKMLTPHKNRRTKSFTKLVVNNSMLVRNIVDSVSINTLGWLRVYYGINQQLFSKQNELVCLYMHHGFCCILDIDSY